VMGKILSIKDNVAEVKLDDQRIVEIGLGLLTAKQIVYQPIKKEKDIKYGFKNMDDNKDYLFNSKEERDKILLKGQSEGKFWNTYTFKNINNDSMILGQ